MPSISTKALQPSNADIRHFLSLLFVNKALSILPLLYNYNSIKNTDYIKKCFK